MVCDNNCRLVWSSHIYGVTVSDPVKMILSLLESSSPIFLQSPNSSDQFEPKMRYMFDTAVVWSLGSSYRP